MIKCKDDCPRELFEGCCSKCPQKGCEFRCELAPGYCGDSFESGEGALTAFEQSQVTVLEQINNLITAKKALEEKEKELKEKLKEAMEKYDIKKFTSDVLNITYVAETTANSIDSKKLKERYPKIAEECSKTSKRSAYVKVVLKDE